MRALAILAALACLCAPARAQVKLDRSCDAPAPAPCAIHLSIEGPITVETASAFAALLEAEETRAGRSVKPVVAIRSSGGDVNVAMKIGHDIRKRAGETVSTGPCHSACVFLAMGGVERNLAGIGLHRPYFARSETDSLAEADARYKRMVRLISAYMFEMNISDELQRLIVFTPPGEIRLLSQIEAARMGLNGVDPAYDELRAGQQAAQYGLSSMDWRNRLRALDKQCGLESDLRSALDAQKRDECRSRLRERILWGLDEKGYARLLSLADESCKGMAPDQPERRLCLRKIAEELRPAPR